MLDEEGVVRYIDWQSGSLSRGQSTEVSNSWTLEEFGNYTVQIFVWDNIDKPLAVSKVSAINLSVTD